MKMLTTISDWIGEGFTSEQEGKVVMPSAEVVFPDDSGKYELFGVYGPHLKLIGIKESNKAAIEAASLESVEDVCSRLDSLQVDTYAVFLGVAEHKERMSDFYEKGPGGVFAKNSVGEKFKVEQVLPGEEHRFSDFDGGYLSSKKDELNSGLAFGVLSNDKYIATTFGWNYPNHGLTEIRIDSRGKGLGTGLVAVITDEIFNRGRTPMYVASKHNISSYRIPSRLGCFVNVGFLVYAFQRPEGKV
jgi:hypothetical protein